MQWLSLHQRFIALCWRRRRGHIALLGRGCCRGRCGGGCALPGCPAAWGQLCVCCGCQASRPWWKVHHARLSWVRRVLDARQWLVGAVLEVCLCTRSTDGARSCVVGSRRLLRAVEGAKPQARSAIRIPDLSRPAVRPPRRGSVSTWWEECICIGAAPAPRPLPHAAVGTGTAFAVLILCHRRQRCPQTSRSGGYSRMLRLLHGRTCRASPASARGALHSLGQGCLRCTRDLDTARVSLLGPSRNPLAPVLCSPPQRVSKCREYVPPFRQHHGCVRKVGCVRARVRARCSGEARTNLQGVVGERAPGRRRQRVQPRHSARRSAAAVKH